MFSRILIANRGEIACRVIATARRMGIATVAVYSEADAQALHVTLADAAYLIGPPPARESYLRGDVILDVARQAGAQAIHPGYGFLSENADFAESCTAAGIVFIGPPAAAIRAMGSKARAKALMDAAGVPLVPGYHGDDQSDAVLAAAAARIGFPVLLKASAGGGGRGMRVVERPEDLAGAAMRARTEAQSAFGDHHLLVEKYLRAPRHIEVQIFADTHGTCVSLFERDCSVQRRHQKVLEESPGPSVTATQRHELGATAVAAARAVDYVGAGTVEFIHEDGRFYFMEMNTRLQVEHPVTEYVTGLDLVEWQLRVAAGERLPQIIEAPRGHAIEARICAEDPTRDFMPSTGRITYLNTPPTGTDVRIDTGIRAGDAITPFYDSMIAKLIVHGTDRAEALRKLISALDVYALLGPHTNLALLRNVLREPDFAAGTFDTGFIATHPKVLLLPARPPEILAAAALASLPPADDALDPWAQSDGWRLNGAVATTIVLRDDGNLVTVELTRTMAGWHLSLPDEDLDAFLTSDGDGASMLHTRFGAHALQIVRSGTRISVIRLGQAWDFDTVDRLEPLDDELAADARLSSPTPARVLDVFVLAGQSIERGDRLMVLEAMKVETTLTAPRDGSIASVAAVVGDMVAEGTVLITLVPLDT